MIMILDHTNIDSNPMYTGSASKDQPLAVMASKALTGPVIGSRGPIVFNRKCAPSRGQINPVKQ